MHSADWHISRFLFDQTPNTHRILFCDPGSSSSTHHFSEILVQVSTRCYCILQYQQLLGHITALARYSSGDCRSVSHNHEPCKNGWTYQDAVWDVDSRAPKEPRIRWGSRHLHVNGQFWGSKVARQGHCLWSIYWKQVSNRQQPASIWCRCRLVSTRWVHICTTWWIWLNRLCAVAMQPYVRLLWPFVLSRLR